MTERVRLPERQLSGPERFAAEALSASAILERTLRDQEIAPKHHARMRAMTAILDRYLTPRELNPRITSALRKMPAEITQGDTGEGLDHITARIRERIRRAAHFFVLPSEQWPNSPLMRMAEVFDDIQPTEGTLFQEDDAARIRQAIESYIERLIPLAFEQQWQDPPQFVSHDWSHSMRVAEHAIGLATAVSETGSFAESHVVRRMIERYGISAHEVQLILYHATVCHDCGYPHLRGRNKSMHAMDSAELALNDDFFHSITEFIQSPNARLDLLRQDMYDAVFYHGADVPQDRFQVRIHTDRGTFLTTTKHFESSLTALRARTSTPTSTPRHITKIEYAGAQSPAAIAEIESIARAHTNTIETRKIEAAPFFIGRKLDLAEKGDELGGVEYVKADFDTRPLLTLLRIADNMDLTSARLGNTRHHPAYYQMIRRIGKGGREHETYKKIERWHNRRHTNIAEVHAELRKLYSIQELSDTELMRITSATAARDWMLSHTIHNILAQPEFEALPSAQEVDPSLPTITRERLIETCAEMRSDVLEHQGGCLAVRTIELVHTDGEYAFRVRFHRKLFDELRALQFTEEGYDSNLNRAAYMTNVAEYQIFRLQQALLSNELVNADGKAMRIGLIMEYEDTHERILPPQTEESEEY